MLENLIYSLVLTLVLELGYALIWGVKGIDLLLVFAMNLLTNPIVVTWHGITYGAGYLVSTLLPEIAAVVTEAWLLCKVGKNIRKPILLAVCINVFSYFTGVILQMIQ